MSDKEPQWLLDCEPREVQLEAIRRSYYGYELRRSKDDVYGKYRSIRNGPAKGWGHLMEMRLGKTPTLLNEFELFQRDHGIKRMVLFAPNSYKYKWALESDHFGVGVPAFPYEQSKIKMAKQFLSECKGSCVFVVNYEALQYDVTLELLEDLVDRDTLLGADESIKIKTPPRQSLFTRGAFQVMGKAGVRRILTGLPMTQGPQDFWAQGRFIGMYEGYNFYAYRNKFCKMGGFKGKKVVGAKNEDLLGEQIGKNAFVAKRKDWGRVGESEYYQFDLQLTPKQADLYAQMDRDLIALLEDGTEISADQVTTKLMKLQQISSGFVYDEKGDPILIEDPRKTPKAKKLLEFVEEELVGKVVIPYHYSKSGDTLLEILAKYEPAVIRGNQWMRDKGRDVESEKNRFNLDPACRVMLLNIANGKYGHDLTGSAQHRCSTMVFYENTYSFDDRQQIEARITTAFQDWANVYMDFSCSPVESRAIEALAHKEGLVEAVLGVYRTTPKSTEVIQG